MALIDGGDVAWKGQGRWRATSDPVDHIGLRVATSLAVRPNFTWSPTLSNKLYPNGDDTGTPRTQVGIPITFVGSYVAAPGTDRKVVLWHWDFGDGSTGFGQTVTHTYTTASPDVRAHLRGTDNYGNVVTAGHYMNLTDGIRYGVETLRGQGTLVVAATQPVHLTTLGLAGTGTLAATGTQAVRLAAAGLSGIGTATVSAIQAARIAEPVALSAQGDLTVSAVRAAPSTAVLSGTGTLAAVVGTTYPAFPLNVTSIDDFNRADGSVTAGAGASLWTNSPNGFGAMTIVGNLLRAPSADQGVRSIASYGPNFDFQFTYVSGLANFQVRFCISGSNYYLWTTSFGLSRIDGGSPRLLAAGAATLSPGDVCGVRKYNDLVAVYRNGVVVLSGTDPDELSGPLDFYIGQSNTTRVDNFQGGTVVS